MKLPPFEMERWQSNWEHRVECNLAESGVYPARIRDFLTEEEQQYLLDTRLGYPQTNGTLELRRAISSIYAGARPDQVLVTTGTAEANYLGVRLLVQPGDHVLLMLPNYMQIWGLVRSQGAELETFHLVEGKEGWKTDLDHLSKLIREETKLIAVCNPNNPTGAVLTLPEMKAVVETARQAGAWILSDEVYRGAELSGDLSPTFWGLYDKVIVTGGLSKAYGIPGLRVGWILSSPAVIEEAWGIRDYTTIAVSATSDFLATLALRSDKRAMLLHRTRSLLRSNLSILEGWIERQKGLFSLNKPMAGAIAYPRYTFAIRSDELAEKLRLEYSLLLVPGSHFHMEPYLRIGYGCPESLLREGLYRLERFVRDTVSGKGLPAG